MTPGAALLWLAIVTGAAALAAPLHARTRSLAAPLARAHAGAMLGALLLLVIAFLVGDLGYVYVWAHTDPGYPVAYRIAGLWGGEEGTMLLWGALVALFAALVQRHPGVLAERASRFLLAVSLALGGILALVDGLDATSAQQLAQAPAGRGLADVLLTPLMVIHPPMQFVAYALMAPVGAFALARWSLPRDAPDERAWSAAAYPWARVAWLFATVGLGLGALWAYYVLSFGGYWVWDPVETSNLLPWLALTAFMHAGKQHMRFGDHSVSAPLLALMGTVLTLFATFATRSGLWVSVHAFTDPTSRFEPDAAARLLAILDAHAPTRHVVALMLFALFVGVALFERHALSSAWRPHAAVLLVFAGAALLDPAFVLGVIFAAASAATPVALGLVVAGAALLGAPFVGAYLARADGAKRRIDERWLMSAAVALFSVALAVTFLLNLQVVNGPDRDVFDARAPFVALPIASVLTLMLARAPLGARAAIALAALGVAGGAAAWFAFPDHRTLALAAPILLAAAIAALAKLVHVQGRGGPLWRRAAGAALLALALAVVFALSNPPTTWGPAVPLALTGGLAALGLFVGAVLTFRGGTVRAAASRLRETGIYVIHFAVVVGLVGYAASTYSSERVVVTAAQPGETVLLAGSTWTLGEATWAGERVAAPFGHVEVAFDWSGEPSYHYVGDLHVHRTFERDVYVSPLAFKTADGWVSSGGPTMAELDSPPVEQMTFSVSVLPLMGLVWGSLVGMAIGMALVLLGAGLARRA